MYSAIKVNGKKLYEYARKGQTIEVKPRSIEIYNIVLDRYNEENNEIEFTVECSKGTYIRTLCENIAEKLNTIGCMKELDRIRVGRFNKYDAIKIDELKQNKDNTEFINKHILSFEDILNDKQNIKLNSKKLELFLNGVQLEQNLLDEVYKIMNEDNELIGTGIIKNKKLKRDIILL